MNPGNVDRDNVFSALSHPQRRRIIEILYEKDATLLDLAASFPFSFQALSKHIKVLESAQIIHKRKQGKYRILSLNRVALQPSLEWISHYSNLWQKSFAALDILVRKNTHNEDGK